MVHKIEATKFYIDSMVAAMLLYIAQISIQTWVATLASVGGFILTILLAVKAYHDIEGTILSNKAKRIENDKAAKLAKIALEEAEQKLARSLAQNIKPKSTEQ